MGLGRGMTNSYQPYTFDDGMIPFPYVRSDSCTAGRIRRLFPGIAVLEYCVIRDKTDLRVNAGVYIGNRFLSTNSNFQRSRQVGQIQGRSRLALNAERTTRSGPCENGQAKSQDQNGRCKKTDSQKNHGENNRPTGFTNRSKTSSGTNAG